MNCCIIQTGRLGDTIIALPIAKFYSELGYKVDWVIHESNSNIFNYINYVDNIIVIPKVIDVVQSIPYAYGMINKKYDKIIDLSICFPGSNAMVPQSDNFVEAKYKIANVPIEKLWDLEYKRDFDKENYLYDLLAKDDYILIHNDIHGIDIFDIEHDNKIYFRPIENFTIFDWRKVIENAKEIHCIDSSFINFVDKIEISNSIKLYEYMSLRTKNKWENPPLKKKWINYENSIYNNI